MIFDSIFISRVSEVQASDIADNTGNCAGLYIGSGGDLKVALQSGDTAVFKNLPDNTFLTGYFARVFSTNTTCSDILAIS